MGDTTVAIVFSVLLVLGSVGGAAGTSTAAGDVDGAATQGNSLAELVAERLTDTHDGGPNGTATNETATPEPTNDTTTTDTATDDTTTNDTTTTDTATNDTATNDTATNDTATNDTATNDTATNDTATNDTATNDTATNDTATNDTATNDTTTTDTLRGRKGNVTANGSAANDSTTVEPAAAPSRCQEPSRGGQRSGSVYLGTDPPSYCHVLGGDTSSGGLRIFVADGLLNVQRYNDGNWVNQYYTYSGALLYVDGEKISLGYYTSNFSNPSGGWGTVSRYVAPSRQSKSGSTVTTVWTVDGLRIEQRVTYTAGAQFHDLTWTIENTGDTPRSDVRFLRGTDTYLANGDFGTGTWNGETNTVGVTKTVNNQEQQLFFQGITDPEGYRSAFYATVVSDVESADLENAATGSNHDNGYALEWREETLGAGEEWTIRALETFVRSRLTAESLGDENLAGLNSATLEFAVTNTGSSEQQVSYTVDAPEQFTTTAPASETLAPGETTTVAVEVTPPEGYPAGTYSIRLSVEGENAQQVQAIGQLRIGERSQPENLPPVVSLSYQPSTPTANEPVQFTASALDPNGNPLSYEWDVGADGTVDGSGRTIQESFERGTYQVEVTVSDGQASTTATTTVQVRSASEVPTASLTARADGEELSQPFEVQTGSQVTFRGTGSTAPGDREITDYEWDLSGGQTATGEVVSRRFPDPGTYTVELKVVDTEGLTDTVEREVTVSGESTRPVIRDIAQPADGLIAQAPTLDEFPDTWEAEVRATNEVERVTFDFPGGPEITDRDGSDGWTASPNLDELRDGPVEVTVVDSQGLTTRRAVSINTFDLPAWGVPYRIVSTDTASGQSVRGGVSVGTGAVGTGRELEFNALAIGIAVFANGETRVFHPIGQRRARMGGSGELGFEATPAVGPGIGQSAVLNISSQARVGEDQLQVETVIVTGRINPELILVIVAIQTPIGEATLQSSIQGTQGVRLRFDTADDLELAGGSYITGLTLTPLEAGGAILAGPVPIAAITVGGEISTEGTIGIYRDGLDGTLSAGGEVYVEARALILRFRESVGPSATIEPLATGVVNQSAAAGTGSWQVVPKRSRQPYNDSQLATLRTTAAAASGSATPLTDDSLADREPAVVTTETGTVAIWSAQQPDETVANGTDLVVRTRENGSWGPKRTLIDDDRYETYPAVATANGTQGLAWSRANRTLSLDNIQQPMDMLEHFEIRVGQRDGANVTRSTRLTDNAIPDFEPKIVGTNDGWLVAWLQDPDANLSTSADRRVQYALLNRDMSVERRGTIDDARAVAVGETGDAFTLATVTGHADATVERRRLTLTGGVRDRTTVTARNVTGLTASGATVAWIGTNGSDRRIQLVNGSAAAPRTLAGLPQGVENVRLRSTPTRRILAYQARDPETGNESVFYHVRSASARRWTDARRLPTGSLPVARADIAITDERVTSVFESTPSIDVQPDVIAASQRYDRPDLAVSARTRNTSSVAANVSVSVSNQGGGATNATIVSLRTPGGTVRTAPVPALAPGERVTRNLTVVTPLAGVGTVAVPGDENPTDPRAANDNATLEFETDLRITRVEDRLTRNGSLALDITLSNEGPFPVRNVTTAATVDNRTTNVTVTGVGVNRTRTVTAIVDAASNTTGAETATVVVNPTEAVPESTARNNRRQVPVRQPDVGVAAEPTYDDSSALAGDQARLFVTSGDTGAATARIEATVGGENRTYLAPVPAARSRNDSRFVPTVLTLPPVASGDSVRVSASPTAGQDTDLGNNVVVDTPTQRRTASLPELNFTGVAATQVDDRGAAAVRVRNPHDVMIGEVIRITRDDSTVTETTVVVRPGATRRVRVPVDVDGTVTVEMLNGTRSVTVEAPARTTGVNATLHSSVNNVGSPIQLSVDVDDPRETIGSVMLEYPNGTTRELPSACLDAAQPCELQVETSTWQNGQYGTADFVVRAINDTGVVDSDTVSTPVYIAGDANGDGRVDIFDAVAVGQAWETSRDQPGYEPAADLNNDGRIDIFDAVVIGRHWRERAG
jgi:PKD repeat protein